MSENRLPGSLNELLGQLNEEGVTGYKRYASVRRFLSFKAREKGVPLGGMFELTPLCNLDCKMCYVHLDKDCLKGQKLLPAETWKGIMKQAVEAGMMYATLSGGECLAYPGFQEIYLFLQSMGVEVSIFSNGLLLNEPMIRFFTEHPPTLLQITLYGASDDAYEKVTGSRCFHQVFENILAVKKANLPVSVSVTPNEYMEDGEDIIRLLHDYNIPYGMNFGIIKPREETKREIHDTSADEYVKLIKLTRELSGSVLLPECDVDELPDVNTEGTEVLGVRCGAGRSGFSIAWDGVMRPCNLFPEVSAKPIEIGFSEAWKIINTEVKTFPIPSECQECKYKSICKHCIAEHAGGAPIGHANSRICEWGKKMVQAGIYRIDN